MASTEIRVNLLFEDNISAVTHRINSLTRSINRLNSAIEQIRGSNGNLKIKVSIDVDDKAINQLKESAKSISHAVGNITRSVNRLNSALEQLKNINGNGVRLNISLDGADRTIKQLREINRMINRLKAHQEVRIRVTFDQSDVVRARRIINYNAIVTAENLRRGRIVINQGIGETGERRRGMSPVWGRIGNVAETIGQFGISYAISGIRFFGVQLPRMAVGIAANYFKTLVGYQKQAYMWMYNVAKQGIDFLRNNVIEWFKRGVQTVANVGRFLIQVPFKYIGGALLRGITGFYSGAIKLFTGMLQAPFKVLRTAGTIFNEIDRWFRHVSQAFYYVSMTFSYISRTAGLIAGAIVGAIVKIFETFKSAVQEQYRIAVTTGIIATPSSVANLQGKDAAKDVRNKIATLTRIAYQINQRSGAAFGDIVNLLYFISSSGFKQTEELKNVTEAVSSVAFATGSEPVALFRSLISVMGAEGIEPTERNINSTLAKIVYAVSEGVFEMGELATQLQRVAAFSEAANTSFEETLSIMAALSKGGLRPETIGTGLSQVFVQLNRPQTQEKMRQYLGVVPIKFEEGIMQQQSIMEIIEALVPSELLKRVKSGELTAADREMLKQIAKQSAVVMRFEKRAQTAWLTMFNKLDDVYKMLREFEGMKETPELLEKYLAYFKEIPNATILATLNKIAGALEYLKTTVLNAVMNKLGANVDQIVEKVKDFADKIAYVVENTNVLSKIFELIKALIRLVIDLITVAVVFGLIATSLRLMAAYFEMIRPTILLLAGFVKGFYSGLSDKHKGDLSKAIEDYVAFMLGIGEKLGELFAKLFAVIEEFVNNMNKLKEAGKSSGEATGQAAAEVIVNLSGILADATGTAVKWVNDFTEAFIRRFNEKKGELTENVKNILLNIFAFDLDFLNIALKFVEGFVGGMKKAVRVSWEVMQVVSQMETQMGKKVTELSDNELKPFIDTVTKTVAVNLGISEKDEASMKALENYVTAYVNFLHEMPNSVKSIVRDVFDVSLYGLDAVLSILTDGLKAVNESLEQIIDDLTGKEGKYSQVLENLQKHTAEFTTEVGKAVTEISIIALTVGDKIVEGMTEGVKKLDEWLQTNQEVRERLSNAVKNFFVSSIKLGIEALNFTLDFLDVFLPALSQGLEELITYIQNPELRKDLTESLAKALTDAIIFAGKIVKFMMVSFPIFADALAEAVSGKGKNQFVKDIKSYWQTDVEALKRDLPKIIGGLIDVLSVVADMTNDVLVEINNAVSRNLEKLSNLFEKIFDIMLTEISTQQNVLTAAAKGLFRVIRNALQEGTKEAQQYAKIKENTKQIAEQVGQATPDLYAIFLDIGAAIVDGLSKGLDNANIDNLKTSMSNLFDKLIHGGISFAAFGLDIAVEFLKNFDRALRIGLELYETMQSENTWKEFVQKRTITISTGEVVKFEPKEIENLQKIKDNLKKIEAVIPGIALKLSYGAMSIIGDINEALGDFLTAIIEYDVQKPYEKQSQKFKQYIKPEDFNTFKQLTAKISETMGTILTNIFIKSPVVITKLLFDVGRFEMFYDDDKDLKTMIATSLGNTLKAALGGAMIGWELYKGPGALIGIQVGIAIDLFYNIREFFKSVIDFNRLEAQFSEAMSNTLKTIEITTDAVVKVKKFMANFTGTVTAEQLVKSGVVDADLPKELREKYSSALAGYLTSIGQAASTDFKNFSTVRNLPAFVQNKIASGGKIIDPLAYSRIMQSISTTELIQLGKEKARSLVFANNYTPEKGSEFVAWLRLVPTMIAGSILAQVETMAYSLAQEDKKIKEITDATQRQKAIQEYVSNYLRTYAQTTLPSEVTKEFKMVLQNVLTEIIGSANKYGGNPETASRLFFQILDELFKKGNVIDTNTKFLQWVTSGIGHAEGGYTGNGGKYEPAGIVHKGEYVIPQWMVKKYPETIVTLERIRKRGYQSGGAVDVTIPLSSNPGQRTITDALVDLGREIGVVASALGNIGDKIDTSVISKVITGEASTKELANVLAQGYTLLSDFSKPIWGMYNDIPALVKNVSTDLDEINRWILGIKEDLENAPGQATVTTKTDEKGRKLTEVTGNVKEILITSAASVFLGQEAGSVFSSLILPFFKDLKGRELKHTEIGQDETKVYSFTDYGIPLLGELTDIVLSFGNWADKLVSDEMLKAYRGMYIYPEQPGGIKGGEGKFESIGDKLIQFLSDLQKFRPFEILENIPVAGTYFAAVDNIFGMLLQRMPGIVKNLITFVYNLESVQKAFSPINTIIEAATEVLKPFIDEAMLPLIEVWQNIGRYIGMALIPIVQIFGGLLKVLMVIFQPVVDAFRLVGKVVFIAGKVVLMVFTKVANAIIDVFNFVIGVINSVLGWLGIKLSTLQKLQEESWEDILKQADELFASTTLGASSGGSGGVGVTSKAENITYNNYITVNFEDMVIADKEELKQLIIDSLKELGLSVGK